MKFHRLLPCAEEEVGAWVFTYLQTVHKTLATIVDDIELEQAALRARNERLASYLGMLNAILSAFRQKRDFRWNQYMRNHRKPERGITEWREARDAELAEEVRICEHVEGVIKAIETRISTTQSNLKSIAKEG